MLTDKSRRCDFPSLENRTYLNSAAEGIPPSAVIESLRQYSQDKILGYDGRELHEAQWHAAKQRIADAFSLTPDEVTICSCSSEAYNLAALALGLQDRDEVVVNDLDFPAGITPWIQPNCPATVRLWRSREGKLRIDDLLPLLNPRTRLVTTSLVSFLNGFMIPLKPMIDAVHRHSSALIALDITQALGRTPLELDGVDLIISSTHKWILSSHGGGLVGVSSSKSTALTTHAGGWFNQQNAFGADRFEHAITKTGAASFTPGMPNYPAVYAINAGLSYIESVGVSAIDSYAQPLVQMCLDGLKRMPVEVMTSDVSDERAGIIAFRHPDAEGIVRHLHTNNIHIHHHAGRLRIAIHGYNTDQDIQNVLRALAEFIS